MNNDFLEVSELYHYGIEGMKWGIRKYQNEDGTLTEEGKKRYEKIAKPLVDDISKVFLESKKEYIEKGGVLKTEEEYFKTEEGKYILEQFNKSKEMYEKSLDEYNKAIEEKDSSKNLDLLKWRINTAYKNALMYNSVSTYLHDSKVLDITYNKLVEEDKRTKEGRDFIEKRLADWGKIKPIEVTKEDDFGDISYIISEKNLKSDGLPGPRVIIIQ